MFVKDGVTATLRATAAVAPILWLLVCALPVRGQAPMIANVTNAAIPALDYPANSIHLAPRSMASIFGTGLADSPTSATAPWPQALAGTEVHLAGDTCFDSTCDLIAQMVYASPTQINFVVPDVSPAVIWSTRVVLIRDGVRIDDRSEELGGPGRVYIDALYDGDYNVVFAVGYECLFSSV